MVKNAMLIFFSMVFFLNACEVLDRPQPTDAFPVAEAFRTGADLENALTGAYDAVQNGHLLGRNLIVLPELMSGNVNYTASGWFGLPEIAQLNINPTNWYVENLWRQAYLAINQLNQIIASLPQVAQNDPLFTPDDEDRIAGEAVFLRGVLYFELVRLFGLPYEPRFLDSLGVPLMRSPVLQEADLQYPARATVGEVYEQVVIDLDLAIEKLPGGSQAGRANRFVALAYRARVAFQQNDAAAVLELPRELLENAPYMLTDSPGKYFAEKNNPEAIWRILNLPGDGIAGGNMYTMFEDARIRPGLRLEGFDSIVTTEQLEKIDASGFRVVDLRTDTGLLTSYPFIDLDGIHILKYNSDSDAPAARLAELVLMRAEALARQNEMNGAVALLNQIRERSLRIVDENGWIAAQARDYVFYNLADYSKEEIIAAIIRERRVELAFEGNYLHDLMRLKRSVVLEGREFPYDAGELRLPIPQREMDVNPNLVQNAGY